MKKDYNNNGYPKPKPTEDKITNYHGICPAYKEGPKPADMGETTGKGQTKKFYKGAE